MRSSSASGPPLPSGFRAAVMSTGNACQRPCGKPVSVKQDFARLTLGMFAGSFSGYPLTFAYGGQAEAPQGKADVIDVKGPANFALKFFVYRDTHLPVMVTWQGGPQPGPGRGSGPGRGGAPGPAGSPGSAARTRANAAGGDAAVLR